MLHRFCKQKKFGLVFEEHLPECTPLYDVPIRVSSKVDLKTGYVSDIYTVINIDGDEVQCDRRETHEQKTFKMDELVTVAEFGEAIYPTLKPIDAIENAPDSDLWHTLIEADNYHGCQSLSTIFNCSESVRNVNDVYIMFRFYEISTCTNSQSAVKVRDLRSNDKYVLAMKKAYEQHFTDGYFITKRGEIADPVKYNTAHVVDLTFLGK